MIQWIKPAAPTLNLYPDSDGKRISDNTKQLRWIFVLYGGITALFRDRNDVFVAGDLLWYAVEGKPEIRQAPDVMVVFGRPKGDRGSYKQWEEADIPPQVAFEVLSPNNTAEEMIQKQDWYEQYGVEEYYVYSPEHNKLIICLRQGDYFLRQRPAQGWVSPRLGIRFDFSEKEMVVYGPDGQRFLTHEELMALYRTEQQARLTLQFQAEKAEERAGKAEERAERTTRLAELSRKVRQGQATATELQELERLEAELLPPT